MRINLTDPMQWLGELEFISMYDILRLRRQEVTP
jgi:hypothetical protein